MGLIEWSVRLRAWHGQANLIIGIVKAIPRYRGLVD